jgi:FkbM family methyltransferase
VSLAGTILRRLSPSAANWVAQYRSGTAELFPPRQIYALSPLHAKIKRQFPFRRGTFFEAGANDGLTQSNTAYLERYLGWRGFLVEPLPEQCATCLRNRPGATVINAALASAEKAGTTLDLRYANLMSIVDDPVRCLVPADEHLALGRQFLGADLELGGRRVAVNTTTVSRILEQAGDPEIDFFSLDVEGYELEVLKGIDFDRHRPKTFLVEVRDDMMLDAFFAARDYRRLAQWSHHDVLYGDARGRMQLRA